MPVSPTYPGVYVEEIPSGVRTITGVATSITAFLGRTQRGPVGEARTIFSFSDFERSYGGLQSGYPLSYAVQDFFLNGGGQAVIARLIGSGSPIQATGSAPTFSPEERKAGEGAVSAIIAAVKPADATPVPELIAAAEGARVQQVATAVAGMHSAEVSQQKNQADLEAATRSLEAARAACTNAINIAEQFEALLLASPTEATLKTAYQGAVSRRKICDQKLAEAQKAQETAADTLQKAQGDLDKAARAAQVVRVAGLAAVKAIETALGSLPFKAPAPADVVATALQGSPPAGATSEAARASAALGGLTLVALDQGAWANELRAALDQSGAAGHYVLKIGKPGERGKEPLVIEQFDYLVADPGSSRNIALVVARESRYVKVQAQPAELGPMGWASFVGGSDGGLLTKGDYKQGLAALDTVDLFNLLCIPPDTDGGDVVDATVYAEAMTYCAKRRAMLIVDPPTGWKPDTLVSSPSASLDALGLKGPDARNTILYFPRVTQSDPLRNGQVREQAAACGIVAGVIARTDRERGVWKAPAGTDAAISGIRSLQYTLTDDQNGALNPLAINCLRTFPVYGTIIWGTRTLRGADQLADEYKYIPVRRLALYIEESLYRGLKWVVFEPNDEPLWAQIRLNVGAFMNNLFRQGAFQGQTPRDAYFVKCSRETTTQNDINLGIVNIIVGFAPLKPAEFVMIKLQQMAGQIAV